MGIGAGWARNDLKQDESLGKSSSDAAFAAIYLSYLKEVFFLEAALWGSYGWVENQREISFSTFQHTAKSTFDSWGLIPHFGFGYAFLLSQATIEPFVSFDWPIQFNDSLSETGADPLDMHVRAQTSSMLRSELGVNFYERAELENGIFLAMQTFSYVNKDPFSVGRVTAAIVGQPSSFTVQTFQNAQNLFSPQAEFFFQRNRGLFLSLRYQGEFGKGYIANQIVGKIGRSF